MMDAITVLVLLELAAAVGIRVAIAKLKGDATRMRIMAAILMAVFAAGIAVQFWGMLKGEQFLPTLKQFAEKYPDVVAADVEPLIAVIEGSAFTRGLGLGLAAGAALGAVAMEMFLRQKMKEYKAALARARAKMAAAKEG